MVVATLWLFVGGRGCRGQNCGWSWVVTTKNGWLRGVVYGRGWSLDLLMLEKTHELCSIYFDHTHGVLNKPINQRHGHTAFIVSAEN